MVRKHVINIRDTVYFSDGTNGVVQSIRESIVVVSVNNQSQTVDLQTQNLLTVDQFNELQMGGNI